MSLSEILIKMNKIFVSFYEPKIFMWIMFIVITDQCYLSIISQTVYIYHLFTINISENTQPD